MSDESLLRDALRRATAEQPRRGEAAFARVHGALTLARRRRQRRVAAASCATALGVVVVAASVTGPGGTAGLQPVAPNRTAIPRFSGTPRPVAPLPASPLPLPGTPPPVEWAEVTVAPERRAPSRTPDAAPPAPPGGGRLDVFVLVDSTTSMTPANQGVGAALASIGDGLARHRVDVAWGLAEYKDTDSFRPLASEVVYRRHRSIGRGVPDVSRLAPGGGRGGAGEAATFALQAALGVGHAPYTASGEGAEWRPGARRVVLLVTDAPFDQAYPNPDIDETAAMLRASGVTVVALHVLAGSDPMTTAADLAWMSWRTGGLTAQSVDCDGDGRADVAADRPLICEVAPDSSGVGAFGDELAGLAR